VADCWARVLYLVCYRRIGPGLHNDRPIGIKGRPGSREIELMYLFKRL